MKKISTLVLMVLFLLSASTKLSAQISGTVFRDYNFNGTQQTSGFPTEPGSFGVEVRAYNSTGAQVGAIKTTNVAGTYSFSAIEIPSGTPIRIEFTAPNGTFDSKTGTANGSSVQFVTAPATTVGYAISSQEWYSQTANPFLATNGFTNGDAISTGVGSAGVNNNLYIFPYDMANDGGNTRRRPNSELGAIYGLSYQRVTRTLLMSAYVKRHAGFGPNGIGAVYKSTVDGSGVPSPATLLVDLTTIGINLGTDPHTGLPTQSNQRNADPNTFAAVGKTGIGGIDLSEDGKTLYVVNMFQNKLHKINVGAPLKTSFTAADVTGTYNITGPAGSLNWHPMACKVANGKVYVGGVYVAEKTTTHNLATDTIGSRGIVYEFDPATSIFTQVLSYPFNYRRGFANSDLRFPFKCNWWCAWQNNGAGGVADPLQADYNTANGAFTGGIYYPQPMISDIEFDVDGSMIIGVRDRFGDQIGYQNVSTDNLPGAGGFATSANNWFRGLTSGEVLRAGKNIVGTNYTIENRGQSTNNGVTTGTIDQLGADNTANAGTWNPGVSTPYGGFYGPGWGGTGAGNAGGPNQGTQGGYFYYNQNFGVSGTGTNGLGVATTLNGTATTAINAHYMKSLGTLALLSGSNEVVSNLMDPVNTTYANGCARMINSGANAGNMAQRLQLVATVAGDPTNGGKSNGMGDIELLTDYQPIEIGNRVWKDANANGKQEPGTAEDGINGVAVQLVSPGINGIFGDGDDVIVANTTTSTVNGQAGSYYFSTLATADARKPVSFNGVGANDILPGFDYQVRILNATGGSQQAALVGTRPTTTDVAGNTADNIDNDGVASGTQVAAVFNSTITTHNLDFGFKPQAALGNRVWRDDNKDGTQDATEPGVAGVTVMLYRNGVDQLPGTADDVVVGATTTDAFGNYFFDNLSPTDQTSAATIATTSYNIRVTPPANYSFTIQTNTTDDNNTTGASTTGSDVNPLGTSYSINLSSGENNPNIDAGLIIRLPVATNSIGDRVWLDNGAGGGTAGNGTADGTEPGVSGVTVTLYDDATGNIVAITTTDANGNYVFNNLPANTNYKVGFSAPAGTKLSPGGILSIGNATTNSDPDPTTGITTTINTGVAGTQITGVDAGLTNDSNGALGDFVWNDLNKNGIQDAGEPGIPGVQMQLYGPGANNVPGGGDDVLIATTTTDAFGYYVFTNLSPAKYFVVATQPVGYVVSPKDVTAANPAGDIKDNDFANGAAPYAGKLVSNVYTLPATSGGLTRDMSVDLGISNSTLNLNSIGDKVWNDINKNGLDDGGVETGVQNVTVRLLTGAGVAVNNPATGKPYVTTTDASGNYKFVDLPDGSYIVEFANLPVGYVFTTQDASGTGAPGSATDGTNDSDAKKSTGRTLAIDLDVLGLLGSQNLTNVDAGITQGIPAGTASIGNRVWYDINNNGLQDAGELGVAGVKVELLDATGAAIDSDPNTAGVQPYIVYTNALGEYSFTGLPAGDYTVKFSNLPAGFTSSAANVGANDAIDADANFAGTSVTATTTATTGIYSLQTGEDNLTIALGIVPAAGLNSLGNFVWNDLNKDGIQTAGEPGVAGVSVNLYTNGVDGIPGTADDVLTAVTVTDSLGRYGFVGLANGNYNVEFANFPAGFKLTPKDAAGFTAANGSDANEATGRTNTIALTGGTNNQDIDAGLQSSTAALGNYVWEDTNGDGIQDATEAGISGVTVTLYASDGTTVIASTITDAAGKYFFANVNPGAYIVGFSTVPSNLSFTKQNTPGDNGIDNNSDADPVTGKTTVITLVAGQTNLTIDAGLKPDNFASVGDFVWNDLDKNGVQGVNEPGVPGILVTLFNSGVDGLPNTADDVAIGTAITDGNGKYLISKIPAGNNYTIVFSNLPATAIFTTQTSNVTPTDATLGSDANTSTGKTAAFNLAAGQYLPTVDAGIQKVQVLPIKINSFTAVPKDSKVNLEWFVSLQINVDKYEIEHSINGYDFRSIQTVVANTNASSTYTGVHATPVTGLNYYRIKTTERDGSISYSEIRKVTFGKAVNIDIYPNPTAAIVFISFSQNMINKSCVISFIAADGKILMTQKINNLSQTESFSISKFATGTYIVRIETGNEIINKKIQIVK